MFKKNNTNKSNRSERNKTNNQIMKDILKNSYANEQIT